MFAAIPSDTSRRLELFYLVLVMVDRGSDKNIPEPLVQHFNCVLHQAKVLSSEPRSLTAEMFPQAVQLANELRGDEELRHVLSDITSVGDLSREIAHKALQRMRA